MTDRISKEQRGANMSAVRSRNTVPEIRVRGIAHRLGYRFRLHRRELPGKPDLAFLGLRKVIFVHGCFWHQHKGCKRGSMPHSNASFWHPKLVGNVKRDAKHLRDLKATGWKTLVVWECETINEQHLRSNLRRFLR